MKESAGLVSEQGGVSGQYLYERLGDKRFQQLCAALLKLSYPDVTCYPVGQRDGGRDVVGRHDGGVVYQVKWAKRQPKNPGANDLPELLLARRALASR